MMPELLALIEDIASRLVQHGWINPAAPPSDQQLIDMLLAINFPAARIPLAEIDIVRDRACALVNTPPRRKGAAK